MLRNGELDNQEIEIELATNSSSPGNHGNTWYARRHDGDDKS